MWAERMRTLAFFISTGQRMLICLVSAEDCRLRVHCCSQHLPNWLPVICRVVGNCPQSEHLWHKHLKNNIFLLLQCWLIRIGIDFKHSLKNCVSSPSINSVFFLFWLEWYKITDFLLKLSLFSIVCYFSRSQIIVFSADHLLSVLPSFGMFWLPESCCTTPQSCFQKEKLTNCYAIIVQKHRCHFWL